MAIAKFEQIKQHIRQEIESGHWPENSRVPSENQLADQFGCSRMTARRALQELSDQGVLVRTQGLGTFVAKLKSQSEMMAIRNIADEIDERGHDYSVIVCEVEQLSADRETAIILGLSEGEPVYSSVLIHLENNLPVQLEQRLVNPALAPGYLECDFQRITPHEFLSEAAPLTEAQHVIEAVSPEPQMMAWLQLADNEPCLQIKRRTFCRKGVVSYARLSHPGSRFRLGGHLTFS